MKKNGRPPSIRLEVEEISDYLATPPEERARFKRRALAYSRANPGATMVRCLLPPELLEYMGCKNDIDAIDFTTVGEWFCKVTDFGPQALADMAVELQRVAETMAGPPSRPHLAQAAFFAHCDAEGYPPTKKELKGLLLENFPERMPRHDDGKEWTNLWSMAGLKRLPTAGNAGPVAEPESMEPLFPKEPN